MDWKLYTTIIDELSELNYLINLGLNFGGESLLHDRFLDMMEYAAAKRTFRMGFNTNGMLLNQKTAQAIVDSRIDSVSVSLDGLEKMHGLIRIGSDYNVVEQNIIHLAKTRGNKLKPHIVVNLTVTEQSSQDIKDFVEYWVNIADAVHIYPCLNEELHIINPERFFERSVVKNKYCDWPFYYLGILWDGNITTCCHDIGGINFIGNVTAKKIMDIWKGKEIASLRRANLTCSFHPDSLCFKCGSWQTKFSPFSSRAGNTTVRYSGLCISNQLSEED
jgi:MoaA/NifB/PqqE/SkfB family radical SAM enzyme